MDSSKKPDRIIIRDLVDRISQATADRHPEKWQHDTDPIVRTIVETMNAQGWEPGGIPGVLRFIINQIESGRVEAHSDFNDLPCADVSLIRADPAQWYVTREAENHILQALATAVERAPELAREKREQRAEQSEMQRVEKGAAGRYTLEEAAKLIATHTRAHERAVLAELLNAVDEGKLTVYEPGVDFPYRPIKPTKVRKLYVEAYWDDLNAWLDGIKFRHTWRLPNPKVHANPAANDSPGRAEPQGTLKRQIIEAIRKLGYDPKALPPRDKRKRTKWVKGDVADLLKRPTKSLDSAWHQLRKDGYIAEQTAPDYPPPKQ